MTLDNCLFVSCVDRFHTTNLSREYMNLIHVLWLFLDLIMLKKLSLVAF